LAPRSCSRLTAALTLTQLRLWAEPIRHP
jgi:hypothetical protein